MVTDLVLAEGEAMTLMVRLSYMHEHIRHRSDGSYYLEGEYHHDCQSTVDDLLIRPDVAIFAWRKFSSMKVER